MTNLLPWSKQLIVVNIVLNPISLRHQMIYPPETCAHISARIFLTEMYQNISNIISKTVFYKIYPSKYFLPLHSASPAQWPNSEHTRHLSPDLSRAFLNALFPS